MSALRSVLLCDISGCTTRILEKGAQFDCPLCGASAVIDGNWCVAPHGAGGYEEEEETQDTADTEEVRIVVGADGEEREVWQ